MLTQEQEQIKSELVSVFKDLENLAYQKRLEFLTAQVLPDCAFKTLKLQKLSEEESILQQKFGGIMYQLLSNFGEDIFNEII